MLCAYSVLRMYAHMYNKDALQTTESQHEMSVERLVKLSGQSALDCSRLSRYIAQPLGA